MGYENHAMEPISISSTLASIESYRKARYTDDSEATANGDNHATLAAPCESEAVIRVPPMAAKGDARPPQRLPWTGK